MSQFPKLTGYVSEIDQCLHQFDDEHPELSKSQQKEITKYQRIYYLRDTKDRPEETKKLWEGF